MPFAPAETLFNTMEIVGAVTQEDDIFKYIYIYKYHTIVHISVVRGIVHVSIVQYEIERIAHNTFTVQGSVSLRIPVLAWRRA